MLNKLNAKDVQFWGPGPLTGDCVCEPRWGHVILSARLLKSATSEQGLEVVVSGVEHFYPNVTTLRSGLCYRNSVCRVVCRLSVVCLSVCNVGAPYSGG